MSALYEIQEDILSCIDLKTGEWASDGVAAENPQHCLLD